MEESGEPLITLLTQERDVDYRLDGTHSYLNKPELDERSTSLEGDGINEAWRLKIAEWAYEVVDYFSFDREAVAIALNYVDRFMVFHCENNDPKKLVNKRGYQLLTVTSLFLAIKLHGMTSDHNDACARPTLKVFVELSQNRFTEVDIERMELQLLDTLKWRLNPPLSVNFIMCLLDLLPNWETRDGVHHSCRRLRSAIYEMARYMTELSICVSDFSFLFTPSTIAYAAILAAMDALEQDANLYDIFPSYQVLVSFFRNISNATSLSPTMEDIRKARSMFIDFCPNVFAEHNCSSPRSVNHMALVGNVQEAFIEHHYGGCNERGSLVAN
jgi:hypothetical protein